MNLLRRTAPTVLVLSMALVGCRETPATAPSSDEMTAPALDASASSHAAETDRETFTDPFPRNPAVDFVPVPAPCLGLGDPLQMSGTWTGWRQITTTAAGREHLTEYIDYSQIIVVLGELRWLPGPSAHEVIVSNWPVQLPLPPGGFTYRHAFNTLFRSQDGLPDLRIRHSWKTTVTGNLDFVHDEFVPFAAECIGNGQ